jgi:hypothetical protein
MFVRYRDINWWGVVDGTVVMDMLVWYSANEWWGFVDGTVLM